MDTLDKLKAERSCLIQRIASGERMTAEERERGQVLVHRIRELTELDASPAPIGVTMPRRTT